MHSRWNLCAQTTNSTSISTSWQIGQIISSLATMGGIFHLTAAFFNSNVAPKFTLKSKIITCYNSNEWNSRNVFVNMTTPFLLEMFIKRKIFISNLRSKNKKTIRLNRVNEKWHNYKNFKSPSERDSVCIFKVVFEWWRPLHANWWSWSVGHVRFDRRRQRHTTLRK